jgi:hypothetical protein
MTFDKSTVLDLMKNGMTSADKKRSADIETALSAALSDYTLRMKSIGMLKEDTETTSDGDRTATLQGAESDLQGIFAVKIESGDDEVTLTYAAPKYFLEEHDSTQASAGTPSVYTILKNDDGWPIIKFNRPVSGARIIRYYYFASYTGATLAMARNSNAALSQGGKAYFYGIETDKGIACYATYKELTKLNRAADSFMPKEAMQRHLSRQDREIMGTVNSIRGRRT